MGYSNDAKILVVRSYMRLGSCRKVAHLTGVSKSSVQRWAKESPAVRRTRGASRAVANALSTIEELLLQNPFDTPASISEKIRTSLKSSLSASAVRYWIKRRGITRKKVRRSVSTEKVEDARLAFANDKSSLYDPERVVSIDESSFYFDMKPSYGYCHRTKRLSVPARPGGRTRWSLLMAVTNERVVKWSLFKGSVNSALFLGFVETLNTDQRDVLLMDNASIHKTSAVLDAIVERGLTPCFLPPYTPEFQPIEHCFFLLKNAYRRLKCEDLGLSTVESAMYDVVRTRLERSMQALTPHNLAATFDACWRRAEDVVWRRRTSVA